MNVSIPLPREHGAWVILLVPYLVGTAVGFTVEDSRPIRALICLPAILLLFISRPAAMKLAKRRHIDGDFGSNAAALARGALFTAGAGLAILLTVSYAGGLWRIGYLAITALSLFVFHTWRSLSRRERSVPGELAGIAMLTLTAPLGCYLTSGVLNTECWSLWFLSTIYFASSVFYVKMKLRSSAKKKRGLDLRLKLRAGRSTLFYMSFMILALAVSAVAGYIPPAALLAYIPILIYMPVSIALLNSSHGIKVEGVVQTFLAVYFGVVLAIAYVA